MPSITEPQHSQLVKLSLVIPCYNEANSIKLCLERVFGLEDDQISLEAIIVDDCSTDGSSLIIAELASQNQKIKFFRHAKNKGKGAALRTGFKHATGDYIGIQDADTEYDPLQYRLLLRPLLEGKADVVYGSRYLQTDQRRVLYFWHTWMNKSLTFISNMFTDLDISDMETCYKLFRREIIQKLDLREDRFGFEPEVTAKIAQLPCRIYECAISYTPRTYEEGKKIGWKDGFWALFCIVKYSSHCAPLPMQLLIYTFIGSFCAIVNILLFLAMKDSIPLPIAVAAAFLIAAVVNYLLCIFILFRHKARWSSITEIALYALSVLAMGLLDVLVTMSFIRIGLDAKSSKIISTGIGFLGNFLLRRFLVFPEKRPRAI